MTLDEAIKHCDEIAEAHDKLRKRYDDASGYSRNHNEAIRTADAKKHEKCNQDFIQLAEWLKELKAYKEQEPCGDVISRELALMCMTGKYIADLEYKPDDIISQHIKRIKALPSVTQKRKTGKWVPISKEMPDEELPEDYQRVLITVVNYAGDKLARSAKYIDLRRWFRVEGSNDCWEVGEKGLLAWMPLPEPYKAESEDEGEVEE